MPLANVALSNDRESLEMSSNKMIWAFSSYLSLASFHLSLNFHLLISLAGEKLDAKLLLRFSFLFWLCFWVIAWTTSRDFSLCSCGTQRLKFLYRNQDKWCVKFRLKLNSLREYWVTFKHATAMCTGFELWCLLNFCSGMGDENFWLIFPSEWHWNSCSRMDKKALDEN